jgi:hypothetical protein
MRVRLTSSLALAVSLVVRAASAGDAVVAADVTTDTPALAPAVAKAPTEKPEEKDPEARARNEVSNVTAVGLRTAMTRARGASLGVSFAGRSMSYSDLKGSNDRASMYWAIGGGGGGVEGMFGGSLAGGGSIDFDKFNHLVGRIGLEGYVMGNDYFYASMFEIPQGQLAYQYWHGAMLLEFGGKTGAVLTGRLRDPEQNATRRLPISLEVGGYATVHILPVRFDASLTRIDLRRDGLGTPVDVGEAAVCGVGWNFSVCIDGRYERGDVLPEVGPAHMFQTTYAGITLGFGGNVAKGDKPPKRAVSRR